MNFFDTKECEWSDLDILVNGVKAAKATGLKFKKSQEKEHIYAAGNEPLDIQRGNKKYDGTLSMLKGAVEDVNKAAIAAGADDLLDIRVQIVCNFRAKGNRMLQTYTLIETEFTEFEIGMMQGDKKQEVGLPLMFLRLKHN